MNKLAPLDALLREWGVKHFSARELCALKNPRWDGPTHLLPPLDVLHHIRRCVGLADRLREVYGKPLRVVSGYRPEAYNRIVGGSPRSQHMEFRALDLAPVEPDDLPYVAALAEAMLDAADLAGWRTGFGIYSSFVHLDVGAETGVKRRWDGRK